MAATVSYPKVLVAGAGSEYVSELTLSGLTAGLAESYSHLGPTGVPPSGVSFEITTAPSDNSVVTMSHTADNTSSNTSTVKFDVPAGGSLDGCVLKLRFRFLAQGTGGLSTITTT